MWEKEVESQYWILGFLRGIPVVERKVSPYLPLADSETHEVVPHQSQ
jgi:hypothetical protein